MRRPGFHDYSGDYFDSTKFRKECHRRCFNKETTLGSELEAVVRGDMMMLENKFVEKGYAFTSGILNKYREIIYRIEQDKKDDPEYYHYMHKKRFAEFFTTEYFMCHNFDPYYPTDYFPTPDEIALIFESEVCEKPYQEFLKDERVFPREIKQDMIKYYRSALQEYREEKQRESEEELKEQQEQEKIDNEYAMFLYDAFKHNKKREPTTEEIDKVWDGLIDVFDEIDSLKNIDFMMKKMKRIFDFWSITDEQVEKGEITKWQQGEMFDKIYYAEDDQTHFEYLIKGMAQEHEGEEMIDSVNQILKEAV